MNIDEHPTSPSVSPPDEPEHFDECPARPSNPRWADDTFDAWCECEYIEQELREQHIADERKARREEEIPRG